jgi:predicted lipid-binding transport protein (Tim44 family)
MPMQIKRKGYCPDGRMTGQIISGDRARPSEPTEFWTFRRDDRSRVDGWQLSAIQQAA